ncbi:MAG: HAD family hydrolase [Myxococcales bacterium]|nr:HAD family hydrolase [Myxococcales bacterium]
MKYSVAFDLDGTLVDLSVDIESARAEIATMFGELGYYEPMWPILDAINRAAASVAKRDEEIYPFIIRARGILDRTEVQAAERATVRPGAVEAIEALRRLGIPMGIATNNSRACIVPALAVLGYTTSDFAVTTRDEVRRPKPAPDSLIRVASKIATAEENMWYVGDSPVDISAAVAANPQVAPNLRAIAVPGPRSSLQQLRAAGPCIFFDTVADAVAHIIES